jgi:hypothetical protein
MKHGGVSSVIESAGQEQDLVEDLAIIEDKLNQIREKIRLGSAFSSGSTDVLMTAVGQGVTDR